MPIRSLRALISAFAVEASHQRNIGRPGFEDAFDQHQAVGDEIHATDGVAWLRLRHQADGTQCTFREWLWQQRAKVTLARDADETTVDRMSVAEFAAALGRGAAKEPAEAVSADDDQRPADDAQQQPSLEARALALLADHPDWSDTQIAKSVPCARQSLYRFARYVAARELLKQSGKASQARGTKAGGHLEAWESDEE